MKSFLFYLREKKNLKKIFLVLGICIAMLFVFQAGVFVGFHKASFAFRGGENYYRAFSREGRGSMMRQMFTDDIPGGHGAAGKVIGVATSTFVISSRDNTETIIHVLPETLVKKFRENSTSSEIVIGDSIVIIGNPNEEGEIDAKLIRVLPMMELKQ